MVEGSMKRRLLFSFSLLLACHTIFSAPPEALAKKAALKAKESPSPAAETTTLNTAPAPKDNAPSVVPSFEQRLFFKTYADDPLTSRISRIEKQVFGQAIEAPMEERVSRLEEILRNKLEEERKNQPVASATPAPTSSAPRRSAQPVHPEEELERARLSIQAARDEEISGLLAEGVELYRLKRGMQAQDKFEQVLRLDPQNAQAHFNLGIIEETMGNYVEALASYRQAAQKEPDNKEYIEAVTAIEKKANAQARSVGKRADLRVLAESANAAWKRGEYISALDLYQQLDSKEPNRALVKYNIGSIYLMLKDQHSALESYKQAAKLEPGQPKYAKAYQDLANEINKENKQLQKVTQAANTDWQKANTPTAPKQKGKASKKAPKNSAPQFSGSPFAPYAVMGGMQGIPGMQQQPMQQQPVQQQPVQQRPVQQRPVQQQSAQQRSAQQPMQQMQQPMQQMQQPMQQMQQPMQQMQQPMQQMQQPMQQMQPSAQQFAQGRPSFGMAPNVVNNLQQPQMTPMMSAQQLPGANVLAQWGLIGRSNGEGITVVNVGIASRALSAGVIPGDDIKAVDGIQVTSPAEMADVLSKLNPAQRIPVLIMRNGNLAVLNL